MAPPPACAPPPRTPPGPSWPPRRSAARAGPNRATRKRTRRTDPTGVRNERGKALLAIPTHALAAAWGRAVSSRTSAQSSIAWALVGSIALTAASATLGSSSLRCALLIPDSTRPSVVKYRPLTKLGKEASSNGNRAPSVAAPAGPLRPEPVMPYQLHSGSRKKRRQDSRFT
eukprot:scaffold98_cov307-Prasinococcus_capsulatus_cf.AAC.3